jgi:hypothetical protein
MSGSGEQLIILKRSAPRDFTPAQALARSDRRVLRFRRDGPWCDLIAAGGQRSSHGRGPVSAARDDPHSQLLKGSNTYFAATLIAHVIPAPRITPPVFKLLEMTVAALHLLPPIGKFLAAASAHPIVLRSPECVQLDASGQFVALSLFHGEHNSDRRAMGR